MSFYMTLPSDSSADIFPDNRIGSFNTNLAREVVLERDYEIGLSECIIPNPRSQVKEPIIYKVSPGEFVKFDVDVGQLAALVDGEDVDIKLPKVANSAVEAFRFSAKDRKIVLHVAPFCTVKFTKENKSLAGILGFPLATLSGPTGEKAAEFQKYLMDTTFDGVDAVTVPDITYRGHQALHPFGAKSDLSFVYIYCDVAEYSAVGDTMVPCLRTIPVTPGSDKTIVLRFENPHYVPVSKSRFSTISILMCNDLGDEIRFNKGRSLVKLHFRPKKR